jgi:hypothetical protein
MILDDSGFLDIMSKVKTTKEKIDKQGFIKIKNVVLQRT